MKKLPKKYYEALGWIALNDDTNWLDEDNASPSVTLSLVADLFKVSDEDATDHLRKVVYAFSTLKKED